jgi:stress-induced-phosphoprotein 1
MATAADFKAEGNKHLQSGNYEAAIEAYSKAIDIDSTDKVFFSNRSAAYLSKGSATEAYEDACKCVELDKNWAKGHSRKGAALHKMKDYAGAKTAFEEGLEACPGDASLQSGLADVEKLLQPSFGGGMGGDLGGGLFGPQMLGKLATHPKWGPKLSDPAFRTKLSLVNGNPSMMLQDPEMMELMQALIGQTGADLTGAMGGTDGTDMGGAAPEAAPQKPPEPPKPVEPELTGTEKTAKEAKERGNKLYKEKDFEGALAAYDEAVSADPTNCMLHNNKAAVYIEMKAFDDAFAAVDKAMEIAKVNKAPFEDRAKIFCRQAGVHLKMDNIPAALECFGKAQMENFDKAVDRKVKNLELEERKRKLREYVNPEKALEAKERGNTCFREGKWPDAIKEYEEATKRDPENPIYRNNLASALVKIMDFNGAKSQVDKALDLDPNYVKAWAKKGDIEFFMKEYHKAMDSYNKGLAKEPNNTLCKEGIAKTQRKIYEANAAGPDAERQAHAMADPEIQMILQDPSVRQLLTDFQENPKYAQQAMAGDPSMAAKINKLVAAGVLQVG